MQVELPDIGQAAYLVSMATESGLLNTWSEINAWSTAQHIKLTPFESEVIFTIGRAFNSAYAEYDMTELPRPYYNRSAPRNEGAIKNALRGR